MREQGAGARALRLGRSKYFDCPQVGRTRQAEREREKEGQRKRGKSGRFEEKQTETRRVEEPEEGSSISAYLAMP